MSTSLTTVLPPTRVDDHLHRTSTADPPEPAHLAALRRRLETLGGDEIREKVLQQGLEATVREFSEEVEELKKVESKDGRRV